MAVCICSPHLSCDLFRTVLFSTFSPHSCAARVHLHLSSASRLAVYQLLPLACFSAVISSFLLHACQQYYAMSRCRIPQALQFLLSGPGGMHHACTPPFAPCPRNPCSCQRLPPSQAPCSPLGQFFSCFFIFSMLCPRLLCAALCVFLCLQRLRSETHPRPGCCRKGSPMIKVMLAWSWLHHSALARCLAAHKGQELTGHLLRSQLPSCVAHLLLLVTFKHVESTARRPRGRAGGFCWEVLAVPSLHSEQLISILTVRCMRLGSAQTAA